MTYKTIQFDLKNPVRLIPLKGETNVNVRTNGDVMIIEDRTDSPRRRDIVQSDTGVARLKITPGGQFRKVEICLRTDESCCERFYEEMENLFAIATLENHI